MEMRWGLTLVSFLPSTVHDNIVQLHQEISNRWNKCSNSRVSLRNFYFEFYHPSHFHCTHFTLKRSTPCGPLKKSEFVKKGYKLFDLFKIISESTAKIREIGVTLDRLTLSPRDGVGLILLGQCANKDSKKQRSSLLEDLNSSLPKCFDLSPRKWDTAESKFDKFHTCIGFQKRQFPQDYGSFADEIKKIKFGSISFVLEEITLVHHKSRTLSPPQEGSFTFPFGEKIDIDEDEFSRMLNMA
jgi:hypothetical protein